MALEFVRTARTRFFKAGTRTLDTLAAVAWMMFESGLFVAAGLALAHWLNPDDPFGLRGQFPWLWLVPALLALRYGSIEGLFAASLLFSWWFIPHRFLGAPAPEAFPQQFFLGGVVLVLVCGQFADVWNTRLDRVRAVNGYLDDRLKTLTRSHFLLKLSHERIEQELLVRPITLRDLLDQLQIIGVAKDPQLVAGAASPAASPAASASGGADAPANLALPVLDSEALTDCEHLMRVLTQSCELEDASIHRFVPDRSGRRLEATPVTSTGEPRPLKADDALLRLALESSALAHVQASDASLYESDYLICAPIQSSNQKNLGMLVVRGMRFFALNNENLQLISVLCGYYADALVRAQVTRELLTIAPTCPIDFALELVRLQSLFKKSKIESALVGLVFNKTPTSNSVYEQVSRMRRSSDLTWQIELAEHRIIVTLLSLAGKPAVEGFLLRIETDLRQQFDTDFAGSHVAVHVAMTSSDSADRVLDDFLVRCRVPTRPALSDVLV